MNRNSMFIASLKEAHKEETVFAWVGEETATVVASENHMMGVVRNDNEASGRAWHAIIVDRSGPALRCRGLVRNIP